MRYIEKPFNRERFRVVVRALVQRGHVAGKVVKDREEVYILIAEELGVQSETVRKWGSSNSPGPNDDNLAKLYKFFIKEGVADMYDDVPVKNGMMSDFEKNAVKECCSFFFKYHRDFYASGDDLDKRHRILEKLLSGLYGNYAAVSSRVWYVLDTMTEIIDEAAQEEESMIIMASRGLKTDGEKDDFIILKSDYIYDTLIELVDALRTELIPGESCDENNIFYELLQSNEKAGEDTEEDHKNNN